MFTNAIKNKYLEEKIDKRNCTISINSTSFDGKKVFVRRNFLETDKIIKGIVIFNVFLYWKI